MIRSALWVGEVVLRLAAEVASTWVGSMVWAGIKTAALLWAGAYLMEAVCR